MTSKYDVIRQPDRSLVDVTYDFWFKYLFFDDSQEGQALLRHLLEVFLPTRQIKRVELLEETLLNANAHMMQERVDGACRIDEKDIVIMEMQRKYRKGDEDRFVRYVSGLSEYRRRKLMTQDQGRNMEIVFLREPFQRSIGMEDESVLLYRNMQGEVFSKLFQIRIIKLYGMKALLKKDVKAMSREERYRLWLRYGHEEKHRELMKEIVEKEEGLKMAETRIKGAMDDKKLFHEIMSDIKRYCDEEQRMLMQKELAKETAKRKRAEMRRKQAEEMQMQAEAMQLQAEAMQMQAEAKQKQSESELKKANDMIEKMRSGFSYEEALVMCKQ